MNAYIERAAVSMLAGVLFFAAANSLSYFVRTGGNLQSQGGRIGFPWLVWQDNGRSGGQFDPDALLANVAVGLSASIMFGCLSAALVRPRRAPRRGRFANSQTSSDASDVSGRPGRRPPQFSLRGMLLLTTLVAVLLALGQEADQGVKRRMLIPLYWLGPGLLVSTYCLTARLAPRMRSQSVSLVAALTVAATCILGASAGFRDFTQIALGFYIYWTPQCVLLLASWFAWQFVRAKVRASGETEA